MATDIAGNRFESSYNVGHINGKIVKIREALTDFNDSDVYKLTVDTLDTVVVEIKPLAPVDNRLLFDITLVPDSVYALAQYYGLPSDPSYPDPAWSFRDLVFPLPSGLTTRIFKTSDYDSLTKEVFSFKPSNSVNYLAFETDRSYDGTVSNFPYEISIYTSIDGSVGNDTLKPSNASLDICIDGLEGDDLIYGGTGNDYLIGSEGNDYLVGDVGDDILRGTRNRYTIPNDGDGAGTDPLWVGSVGKGEIDTLTGGAGKDRFVLGDGRDSYNNKSDNGANNGNFYNIPVGEIIDNSNFLPITEDQLYDIMPSSKNNPNASDWLKELNIAMQRFAINTPSRQRAFLAQVAVETRDFTSLVESFVYDNHDKKRKFKNRLNSVFGGRGFTDAWIHSNLKTGKSDVSDKPGEQIAVANKAYASLGNVFDNGVGSNDGWKYRGRGFLQLTGKYNYEKTSRELKLGYLLANKPDLVVNPQVAADTAGWYWNSKHLNQLSDDLDDLTGNAEQLQFKQIVKKVNTGLDHLIERKQYFDRGKKIILNRQVMDNDYAIIKDFNSLEDTIQLTGSKDLYRLISVQTQRGDSGVGIFRENELIGVIQGDLNGLSRNGNYFNYV